MTSNDLLEILVSNGAVALVLALAAVLATGLRARPALVHALWVLVLLKLVTPPVLRVPVALPTPVTQTSILSAPPTYSAGSPVQVSPAARLGDLALSPGISESPGLQIPWLEILLGLWVLGTAFILLCTLRDMRRMKTLVRSSLRAPRDIRRLVRDLSRRLGLGRAPDVRLVSGKLSPMVWASGGPPVLLLPDQLLPRLDRREQTTLLAHELAHLRRKDHLVRYLEVLVRSLYWWNPLVWWACRQLRIAEEECCDGWVLWALPRAGRTYADALLQTVEFLSDSPAVLPAAASGVGRFQNLKRRLTMIMQGKTRRCLSSSGRGLVLGLAALALPLLPVHGQDTDHIRAQKEGLHKLHTHLTQLHEEMAELHRHAEHLTERGDLHEAQSVKHQIAQLQDRIEVESRNAADLAVHLELQDRPQELGTHEHNPKEILAALHEAIDALRDRDQDDEAAVLENLARGIMHDVEQEVRHEVQDNAGHARMLIELERELAAARDHATMELHQRAMTDNKLQMEMDRAEEQRHLLQMEDRLAEERHLLEMRKTEIQARSDAEALNRALVNRKVLEEQLHQSAGQQNDQMRRLEDRVDELADMVKKLVAEMAKKQRAERDRRIR